MHSARPQLLLFDCDGTLFVGEDELALSCMVDALSELTAVTLPGDLFRGLHYQARTARWLARQAVHRCGLPRVDPETWVQRALELYCDRFDESVAVSWQLADDAEPALRRLLLDDFDLALVTGIPEALARFRLERLGIGGYFPAGTGAFGCEVDEWSELLRLALWRSACTSRNALEVRGTSRDAGAAGDLGVPGLVVGANGIVPSLGELPEALRELRRAA